MTSLIRRPVEHPDSDPVETRHADWTHKICLCLASISFLAWLASSYAISHTIQSISRLLAKFLVR